MTRFWNSPSGDKLLVYLEKVQRTIFCLNALSMSNEHLFLLKGKAPKVGQVFPYATL